MSSNARMRAHQREHVRRAHREGGPRQVIDSVKTATSVRLLDPLATQFLVTPSGGPPVRMRLLDLGADGEEAEAFLLTFFDTTEFADSGYGGPSVPPDDGRTGARFDELQDVKLLNFPRLLDVTLFRTDDMLEMRNALLCADRADDLMSPYRRDDLSRRMKDLDDEGVQAQPLDDDQPEEPEEVEIKEWLDRNPLRIAMDDIEDAIGENKSIFVLVVRAAAGDGDVMHICTRVGKK